ncbi:MAG: SAM-dependent methyltransferase [Chloroflexota bacterium]|nr:MAG: SAM-dependent methyltransferase [Chloroflexota bacterium]
MNLESFYFLLTPAGQSQLSILAESDIDAANHLHLAGHLSREVGPERAHALLETTLLRRRAAGKFSRAAEMYFTREALQQASSETVSGYRARRFAEAGYEQVADLGCGIGGDALALAESAEVIGVEWDPIRLAMAQENLRVYGRGHRFLPLQADLLELSPLPVEALFADPGRRDEHGRRIFSVYKYRPPLTFLDGWRKMAPHQAVKISPGVAYEELPLEAEVEFISVAGEVREAVLWFGDLRGPVARRATLLPGEFSMTDDMPAETPIREPLAYLYEPDGAIIRAHLVEQLACLLNAAKIDKDIAYLTADRRQETPFARCYALEDSFPFQLKRLRAYLRERGIGQVTVKKRGSPIDPDELRRRLRLKGERQCTIFLTRVQRRPMVLIGQPAATDQGHAS